MNCKDRKENSYYRIKGIKSNSSSPTDTWLVTYYNKDTNEIICKSFIKIWISGFDYHGIGFTEEQALNYEAQVYKQIKKDILDTNRSKSFVEILDFSEDNSFEEILNILVSGFSDKSEITDTIIKRKQHAIKYLTKISDPSYTDVNYIDIRDIIQKNLLRNLGYMLCRAKMRPDIYDAVEPVNTVLKCIYFLNSNKNDIKFNFIETRSMENAITFNQLISTKKRDKIVYKVFQKILEAVDVMNSDNIFHQDLHFGNIFVEIDDDDNISVYIYDFDRAFSEQVGINKNLYEYCELYGSCNEVNQVKDFLKLFCGMFSKKLISELDFKRFIFLNYDENKINDDIIYYMYFDGNTDNCFLPRDAYVDTKHAPFNTRTEMLSLYDKYIS